MRCLWHDAGMGEIVNLRRVRRQRARDAEDKLAAENRVRHGRTKAERDAASAVRGLEERRIDQARLDRDGEPGE